MAIDCKKLIAGNCGSFSEATLKLINVIKSDNESFQLNDPALSEPYELAVALVNYPIQNDKFYKEFAEAAKKISSAKYAYYKKSSIFKDTFYKLCVDIFNKHHQGDLSERADQIEKVQFALKVVKFIGELYNSDFIINCNLKYFLDVLVNKSEVSKVSDDCLKCLIGIISDRVKEEEKRQHKQAFNVHVAAIMQIIREFESNGFDNIRKNYKDLEIIETVDKTFNKKTNKIYKTASQQNHVPLENFVMKRAKKTLDKILTNNTSLEMCIKEEVYDGIVIFPTLFESEMMLLCMEYLRKVFEEDDESLRESCMIIVKFIGKSYEMEIFNSDSVEETLTYLFETTDNPFSKLLIDIIINEIYEKIFEKNDEQLKSFVPDDFEKISYTNENETQQIDKSSQPLKRKTSIKNVSTSSATSSFQIVNITINKPTSNDPLYKFREILSKISPTNIAFILREIAQIRFVSGEETIKECASILIEHAIMKQNLIKPIVQVCAKLHEAITPNFIIGLTKKHIKATISSKIFKCSENEAIGYSQLVKEFHSFNFYDRFDVIILLESFTENFNQDRTALPSLLIFITELEEIIICNKKLSKNMRLKLTNITQLLSVKVDEEVNNYMKDNIENSLKILKGEGRALKAKDEINDEDDDDDETIEVSTYRTNNNNNNYVISYVEAPFDLQDLQYYITTPPPKMLIPPYPILTPQAFPPLEPLADQSPATIVSHQVETITENVQSYNEIVLELEMQTDLETGNNHSPTLDENQNITTYRTNSVSSSLTATPSHTRNMNESDEFYDTVSNADDSVIESESISSSNNSDNRASNKNQEEDFKTLIKNRLSNDIKYMEQFIDIFINRGMKCKAVMGYMKLIETVEEGLRSKEDVYDLFLSVLERKMYEKILSLKQAEEEAPIKQRDKECRLVIMIGEMYNMELMSQSVFITCLKKLWNDIVIFANNAMSSRHQITLFHLLIKICVEKIVENELEQLCKWYLDELFIRVETFNESAERNLISSEIVITLKVLSHNVQKSKLKCPIECFKLLLSEIPGSDISSKVRELKSKFSTNIGQLKEMLHAYIDATISKYQPALFATLAYELHDFPASDDVSTTFGKLLDRKIYKKIRNCLSDVNNSQKMIELFQWTSLIGDLYLENAISISSLSCYLQMLFEKENLSKKIVDCINFNLRKIGDKIDRESEILNKFFLFFIKIAEKESSYRSEVYTDLIKLRSNDWKRSEEEKFLDRIGDMLGRLNDKNMIQMTLIISKLICKSNEFLNDFIKLLWKFIIFNSESVLKFANLSNGISKNHHTFGSELVKFLFVRNIAFNSLACEYLNEMQATKLSTVIIYVSYLHAFHVIFDDDLKIWMTPNLTKYLSMETTTKICNIVQPNMNECYNKELIGYISLLEYNNRENNFFGVLKSVMSDMTDLINQNN